jgi:hypothetical protein
MRPQVKPKTIQRWVGGFVAAVVVAVIITVLILGKWHGSLVENCEKNGNPLREAVQQVLREEIKQTENKTLLHEFFPQISEKHLDEVIEESVKRKQKTIRRIAPVDCQKAYNK